MGSYHNTIRESSSSGELRWQGLVLAGVDYGRYSRACVDPGVHVEC